jgi:hypothetical protein
VARIQQRPRIQRRLGARSEHPAAASPARALLTYNLARAGLLAACLGLGWLAGLRGLLLIVIALLASGALSWFLLAAQRVNMGAAIERTVGRSRDRMAARTAAEDAYADDLERHQQGADDQPPS